MDLDVHGVIIQAKCLYLDDGQIRSTSHMPWGASLPETCATCGKTLFRQRVGDPSVWKWFSIEPYIIGEEPW